MKISGYASEKSNEPIVQDLSWDQLAEALTQHTTTPCAPCPGSSCEHKRGPSWAPHVLKEGKTRGKNAVLEITALVYDLDHQKEDAVVDVLEKIKDLGWSAILHSTHSHRPPNDGAYRLILQLEQSLDPCDFASARTDIANRLGLQHDTQTDDDTRIYFAPSCPAGSTPDTVILPGQPISFPKTLTAVTKNALVELPHIDLDPIRNRLRSVSKPESKALIKRVLKGEPLAPAGERDTTLARLVGVVAFALPKDTPWTAIEPVIEPSLRAMEVKPGDEDWVVLAKAKWERSLSAAKVEEEKRAVLREESKELLALLSKHANPEVTDAEAPPMSQRIIQNDGMHWVWINGAYRAPRKTADLRVGLRDDLGGSDVDLMRPGAKGPVLKTTAELLDECSTAARKVSASLVLQRSYYDVPTQTFHEAVLPLRVTEAVFHPQIDQWLGLLGGDKLRDWVGAVTRLNRQCAALYLEGKKSAGKNLLATGLARLWTQGGPAEMGFSTGQFNADMLRCPLLFADEALPRDKDISIKLRRLIGSTVRTINEKNRPTCPLVGAVRIIIAGNNPHLLESHEDLSQDDIEAVSERILHVRVTTEASNYLASLGGPPVLDLWIQDDLIAKHALWLRENRVLDESRRFLVTGENTEIHRRLATGSNTTAAVCEWLTHWLSDPKTKSDAKILIGSGHLWVNANAMSAPHEWMQRVPSMPPFSAQKIAKSMRTISLGAKTETYKGARYWRVNPSMVMDWAERNAVGDLDQAQAKLNAENNELAARAS